MNIDLLFLVDQKDSSTKSLIVKCLAVHQSLTNAQLQRMLKKEFRKRISYQAIRQALTEMVGGEILVKNDGAYEINAVWVARIRDSVDLLEKSLVNRKDIKTLDEHTTQITLRSHAELGYFVLFGLEHKYFNFDKPGDLMIQFNHLWIPFADMDKRQRLLDIFKKNNTYVVVKGKTATDRMLASFYRKHGKLKLGAPFKDPCEYLVHGDCVVQIFMPKELTKKMDEAYKLKTVISMNLFKQVTDITYSENQIQLIITRNADIAKKVGDSIKSYF